MVPAEPERSLVVLRCRACGDTFPATRLDDRCPSCGGTDADLAAEPLL